MAIETSGLSEQVSLLLKQVLGYKVELVGCKIGNQQHDYVVLLVQLRSPLLQLVVKLAGPEAAASYAFDRIAALHRLVATHTTVPVSDVLAVDVSYERWPWRFLVRTHSPGQEWAMVRSQMNGEQLSDGYRQIANAVAQLHTIGFPSFGELTSGGEVQGEKPLRAALEEHASLLIQNARLRDLYLSVLDRHAHLFMDIREATLCHEDLHGYNILFENQQGRWRLTAILDFAKAWAGHHETDLARMDFWTGMTSDEFWQTYESMRPVDPLYEKRRPIYQLLWCLEYARSTAKHLDDTRQVCAELGIPPIEQFR